MELETRWTYLSEQVDHFCSGKWEDEDALMEVAASTLVAVQPEPDPDSQKEEGTCGGQAVVGYLDVDQKAPSESQISNSILDSRGDKVLLMGGSAEEVDQELSSLAAEEARTQEKKKGDTYVNGENSGIGSDGGSKSGNKTTVAHDS